MPSPSFGDELVEAIRAHLRENGWERLGQLKDGAAVIARLADELFAARNLLTVNKFVDTCEEEGDEYMSTTGYTKLFGTIVSSTIWQEPKETKVLWITMLAMSDRDGRVDASIPGLANIAGLTITETEASLKTLLSPDPYSRTKAADGRRIEEVPGGWKLINHAKYRDMMNEESRREYLRKKQQEHRAKVSTPCQQVSTNVSDTSTPSTHTDSDTDTDEDTEKRILARKPRERNLLMDALAAFEDIPASEIAGNGSRLSKAIKAIRASTPDVTPDEIRRRAANYETHFPGLNRSATGLAKWWSKCHAPKDGVEPRSAEAEARLNAF